MTECSRCGASLGAVYNLDDDGQKMCTKHTEEDTEECVDCQGNGAVNNVPCSTCDGFGYIEKS